MLISALSVLGCAAVAGAQAPDSLPFGCGERLTFGIHASKFGTIGHATMTVDGPEFVRGVPTLLVEMDTRIGVLFMHASDSNKSWIDPRHMTALRFEKHQRRPFSALDDSVEIFPDLHQWTATHGAGGSIADPDPLDELSFIYFLRTFPFGPDTTYSFDRMYDRRRNSTTVRIVKRELLRTAAGEFLTDKLEIHFKDGPQWKDDWVVHLWISQDPCRLPVRMESAVPILGSGYLTLESALTNGCAGSGQGTTRSSR
jgi:hypothetical protein